MPPITIRALGAADWDDVRRIYADGIATRNATFETENLASLAIHRAAGFREVGHRERIAQLAGAWRDTILLERRAPEPS